MLMDPCRRRLVPDTREERVRQAVVEWLQRELAVPLGCLSTEENLARLGTGSRRRADVVVWRPTSEGRVPLAVVEVKRHGAPLTQRVLAQAFGYAAEYGCAFLAAANDTQLDFYRWEDAEQAYIRLKRAPTYLEMCSGAPIELDEGPPAARLPFSELSSAAHARGLMDEGVLGEATPTRLRPLVAELHNLLLAEACTAKLPLQYHGLTLREDRGSEYASFGNASGGSWTGDYRTLLVRSRLGDDLLFRLGVLASGNGTSMLIVGADRPGAEPHSALQLCLDAFVERERSAVHLWHDGRMTVGHRGGVPRSAVVDFVGERAPHLLQDSRVSLGRLPAGRCASWREVEDFLLRVILYAALREELRAQLRSR